MNQRPSGYEPDELPDCSTPRSMKTAFPPVSRIPYQGCLIILAYMRQCVKPFFQKVLHLRRVAYDGAWGWGRMPVLCTLFRAMLWVVLPLTAAVCVSEEVWRRRRELHK